MPHVLRDWVGLAITDDSLMAASILLSGCRYKLSQEPDDPLLPYMALQYKKVCLSSLRNEVSSASSQIKPTTVAKVIALAIDEVSWPLAARPPILSN
jgi:hypothetical protein